MRPKICLPKFLSIVTFLIWNFTQTLFILVIDVIASAQISEPQLVDI